MKKILISFVLATFLLVCAVPSVSAATHSKVTDSARVATVANAMVFPTDETNTTAYCPVCCKSVTWKPLTKETIGSSYTLPKSNAHYYLTDSVTTGSSNAMMIAPNSSSYTVCLHLNNKDLTNTAGMVFEGKAGKLNIMGSGNVKGGHTGSTVGATVGMGNVGYINLYGGTYAKNSPSTTANTVAITWGGTINIYSGATIKSGTAGSAVYLKGSLGDAATSINMFGGTIDAAGGSEAAVELAAAVLPNTAGQEVIFVPTFNMYGGTIQNGSNANGGNVAVGADSVLNVYGGTIQKGSATNGGNVYLSGGATLNMYGGNITDGTATEQGGSIYATNYVSDNRTAKAVINIYDGTVSSSSATNGGNISLSTNTELNMFGGTVEKGTATDEGGNIYTKAAYGVATSEWVNIYLENATISGGKVTGNGGNLGLTRTNLTIEEGTKIENGTADGGRGGNFRIYHGKVVMNGGVISGGNATSKYANGGSDDIWLQGASGTLSTMYMLGGKIDSLDDRDGSALTVHAYGRLYLGGNASTVNKNSAKAEIFCTGMVYICNGWTGTSTISYADNDDTWTEGSTVTNSYAKVVTLDAQNQATDGGSFSGKLIHQDTQLEIRPTSSATLAVGGVSMVSVNGTVTPTDDPLAAWDTGKYAYIRLSGSTYTIDDLGGREICIDLNGCDLTVNGAGLVSAFDSANDTYDATKCGSITGTATVKPDVEAPNRNRYIAVTENNVTTLHRLEMRVNAVALRTSAAGIYYKASFSCDDVLAAKVTKYGMVLSVFNMPGVDFETEEEDINLFTESTDGFISGLVTTSCSVFGILKEDTTDENSQRGQTKIYVNPYVVLDEQVLVGDTENPGKTAEDPTFSGVSLSLRDTMELMDSIYTEYSAEDKDAINQFYTTWNDKGMDWKMANIDGQLTVDNSDLTFTADNEAFCPVCRATVTWKPITQETYSNTSIDATNGSHYYLAEDVIYYGTESFLTAPGGGKTACFHLNGHDLSTVNASARPIMGSGGVLNVMGNGIVYGSFTDSTSTGATVNINTSNSNGTINLYGGTYTKVSVNNNENAVVSVYNNGGQIHLYEGAEILGTGNGYAAYLGAANKANAVFGVHGGKITNGKLSATEPSSTSGYTSTVIVDGNAYLEEIVIRDKAITTQISGNPVIEKLALASGAKVTLGKLLPGADLSVSSNGVFTTDVENPFVCLSYIHAWNAPDSITVDGSALRYNINYEHYMTPYQLDVSAKAVEEGKIHYYFMSGENMVMSTINAGDVYKWGDSCLIAFPNGETMLIDSSYTVHAPVIIGNLKRMGVTKLDYLVITHPHNDHIGGAFDSGSTFFDEIEVGKVYYEDIQYLDNSWVGVVESRCTAYGIPYENLEMGDVLTIGEGDLAATIKVLWPKEELTEDDLKADAPANNNSLVFRLDFGEHSSLFTADIYTATEKKLVSLYGNELDTDLMKIPHHGWSSSNSSDFVSAISPEIAVATGAHEMGIKYWKPYNSTNALLLNDLYDGYIHISADRSGNMSYETSR